MKSKKLKFQSNVCSGENHKYPQGNSLSLRYKFQRNIKHNRKIRWIDRYCKIAIPRTRTAKKKKVIKKFCMSYFPPHTSQRDRGEGGVEWDKSIQDVSKPRHSTRSQEAGEGILHLQFLARLGAVMLIFKRVYCFQHAPRQWTMFGRGKFAELLEIRVRVKHFVLSAYCLIRCHNFLLE